MHSAEAVVRQAKLRRYVSSDHFSVDGTLLEAWASHKSFQPKDGPPSSLPPGRNAEVSFHGQRRSNQTHASTTDPEAFMARKSNATAAKLCYAGHLLMEHRNALLVDIELSEATGYAERDTALEMLGRLPPTRRRRTVAGDKAYDTRQFVADVRELGITPHLAPNTTRQRSTIDGRSRSHPAQANPSCCIRVMLSGKIHPSTCLAAVELPHAHARVLDGLPGRRNAVVIAVVRRGRVATDRPLGRRLRTGPRARP